jgi:hypothetical protein
MLRRKRPIIFPQFCERFAPILALLNGATQNFIRARINSLIMLRKFSTGRDAAQHEQAVLKHHPICQERTHTN